jgi:hypothetical protein
VGAPSDIDRLIELGLNRYGAGDLDGALLMWEEALAVDPDNARANSYVDYVRQNYDMLSGGEPVVTEADEAPMGIEEEPEYQIDVLPGELASARESEPVVSNEALDAGWFDDERTEDVNAMSERTSNQELELELELEADLPPLPEVNFEDATREYYGTPTKPVPPPPESFAPVVPITPTPTAPAIPQNEFETEAGTGGDFSESAGTAEFQHEFTGGFHPEGTPIGFGNQETEIRKRDFGFVQPTAPAAPVAVTDKPSSPLSLGSAPTIDTLSLGELTQERLSAIEGTSPGDKTTERKPFGPEDDQLDERDLLEGLPVPNRPQASPADIETQDIPLVSSTKAITKELPDNNRLPSAKSMTKDLPQPQRAPARRDSADLSQAEVMLTGAATRDFSPKIDIGAPTRELGLRPRPPSNRPPTLDNPVDDDAPTKQSDVRAIRETAREQGRAQSHPITEVTNSGAPPHFDPLEVRAAEILDEVDADAPAGEMPSDQTRRRITLLLDRAVAWNHDGDAEKAVCAVELALDEDPNSAVAQKLITRHREMIMSVMQSYLGDPERQPQLAKSLQDLQSAPIGPRAAFLLSRIDGSITIDELLDVSGMPRLEAYRYLCQLYLRGILR